MSFWKRRFGMSQKRWGLVLSSPVPLTRQLRQRFAIPKFPYTLIYLPSPDELLVVSFFHQHREPGVWIERFNS
ncbi:MAG: hypothetical protein ACYC45_10790 [Acidithiobacillus ferriphilus]